MAIYRRENSDTYYYDFWLHGDRYHGSTETSDLEDARQFERSIRDSIHIPSSFCRAILKRAKLNIGRRAPNGYVYMLRSGYFIKIGHSIDPAERIKTIATATPDECSLLFCLPGDVKLERRLHSEFAACHYQREWFFLCGKLKQFVREFEATTANGTPTEIPVKTVSRLASN